MSHELYEYVSTKIHDPIVEWKTCSASWKEFAIYQSDIDFYDKISPTFAGEKFSMPTPTLCPEERKKRRLSFRNERKLYKRKCDATGEDIISMYSPDKPYKVYDKKIRRSDNRDPMDYGQDFDFSKTFAENFDALRKKVPQMSLYVKTSENCDYVNNVGWSKSCYLLFDSDDSEDCCYSSIIKNSTNVYDSMHIYYCENIFNSINCTESYSLINCQECDRSKFLVNCVKCTNCEYCYMSSNLDNKKYYFKNVAYSREEYMELLWKEQYTDNYPKSINRTTYKVNDHYGIGNNLYGTKNCHFSYNIGFSENMRYCDLATGAVDCYDISSFGWELSLSYNSLSIGANVNKCYMSSVVTLWASDIYYSHTIIGGNNLFGCIWLRNQSYCILNRQYTKEEYEKLVAKIITHMQQTWERWQFFDPNISPFGYNETVAQEYFPYAKHDAQAEWYQWNDYFSDPVIPASIQTIHYDHYTPEQRTELKNNDDVLKQLFICSISGRPYRIVKKELEFYRTHHLPLPYKHPDVRHIERFALLPRQWLSLVQCDHCKTITTSVHEHDVGQSLYCEECYQKKIYG